MQARRAAMALALSTLLASSPATAGEPPVPAGRDPGGFPVALFDTGINYTLPEIAQRLARDGEGVIIGYDFHDDDQRPFDARPGDTRANPVRHGTTVASIILREDGAATLVPLRYKSGDPKSFARMIAHVAQGPARIVAMPLGGPRRADWEPFAIAAAHFKDILFVVSAGNDGRDIDAAPLYPAAFALPNVIVVASNEADGRFPASSNWGVKTVDISTPAERIEALSFDGSRRRVSGSSFAVPRIAALASRIIAVEPQLKGAALKAKIISLAVPNPSERKARTRSGWIPDPSRPFRLE